MFHPVVATTEAVRLHREHRKAVLTIAERGDDLAVLARERKREVWSLRLLNWHIQGLGFEPGQHVIVDGHIYKVSRRGLATYIGQCLPDADPWEAHAAMEAILAGPAERSEWASYYREAVCPN